MKLFGEYLVDEGVISEEQLLAALLDQARSLPTLPELAHAEGALQTQQILKGMAHQAHFGGDFRSACMSLGFWSEDAKTKIENALQRIRVPLGQFLAKHSQRSIQEFAEYFEKYEALRVHPSLAISDSQEKVSVSPVQTIGVSEPVVPTPVHLVVLGNDEKPQMPLPFEPDFQAIEASILPDYIELLNDDKRSEVEKLILSWESLASANDGIQQLNESFTTAYREYHTIKGSARFIRAVLTEKLIHEAEDILSFAKRFVEKLEAQDLERMTGLHLQVFDLVWELKAEIQSHGSEQSCWESETWRKKYLEVFCQLVSYKEELEGRNFEVDLEAIKDAF